MKLAAILRHELAHLKGHDEVRARLIEACTLRELTRGSPHLIPRCMVYAIVIEQHAAALLAAQQRQAA